MCKDGYECVQVCLDTDLSMLAAQTKRVKTAVELYFFLKLYIYFQHTGHLCYLHSLIKALFLWPAFNVPQTGLIVSCRLQSCILTLFTGHYPICSMTFSFEHTVNACLMNEQCYLRERTRSLFCSHKFGLCLDLLSANQTLCGHSSVPPLEVYYINQGHGWVLKYKFRFFSHSFITAQHCFPHSHLLKNKHLV